jgi:ATP-binding cassette subfamily B protein
MHKGSQAFGKAKNFKLAMSKLIRFLFPNLFLVIIAIILAIGGAVLTIISPDYISDITNHIQVGLKTGIDTSAVTKIALLLVLFYSLSAIFTYIQNFIMATVTDRAARGLRKSISQKINRLPLKYYDKSSFGDVLSRVTNDVDTIAMTLNQSITTLITAISIFVGSIIMMFITNTIMALTAIGASLIGFIIMGIIMRKSQKYFFSLQASLGEMNGHIEEIYTNHNIVKVYNGEEAAINDFNKINGKLYNNTWKSQFFSGLISPLMSFIANFGYLAVIVVGGALALSSKIKFGVIVAFTIYVRLFTQTLSQFGQAAGNLQSTAAASERVFEFLDEEELLDESHKTKHLEEVKGEVEFKNVAFGYNPDKVIIKDLSLKAYPGQKIAIVGPTGAGKTTIVNLLMNFYELNSGKILIDNIPIDELTRRNIHDLFSMVLQDTWLFQGTIKENIIYNKDNVSDEDVINACKAVGLHHFIMTLPDGYDTVLSDNVSLSQGQNQLLNIARAMIKNAPMLILDEATSSVDTRTEILIQKAMDQLMEGRTSFVIAHRLSTIKNADLILVMKDGDIIEKGKHEELLAQNGFYAQLYNSQFEEV